MSGSDHTLLTLLSFLSPVFPTGGFAWSAGLEQAVADGSVRDRETLEGWIGAQISHGAARTDCVLAIVAHGAADDDALITEIADLARALCGAWERLAEMTSQGTSFADAAAPWASIDRTLPLPVALGVASARAGIAPNMLAPAMLHGFASAQCQAAIRLGVTGQMGAAETLAALAPLISRTADTLASATEDDLGSATFGADIASMNHETLQPRLFRS